MKYFVTLAVLLFCKISFGQIIMAKINLKDSCIISGGVIKMTDFKRICKICPPDVKTVNSFLISYPVNPPLYMELPCKGNRWKSSEIIKYAKPGVTFIFEEINGIHLVPNCPIGMTATAPTGTAIIL